MNSRNKELDQKIKIKLQELGLILSETNLDRFDLKRDVYISGKGHYYVICEDHSGVFGQLMRKDLIPILTEQYIKGEYFSYAVYSTLDFSVVKTEKDDSKIKRYSELFYNKAEGIKDFEFIVPPENVENYYFLITINRDEYYAYYRFVLKSEIDTVCNPFGSLYIYDAETLKEINYKWKIELEKEQNQ